MEGFFAPPFLGAEGWSGAEQISWSGVRKKVPSEKNGAFPSLAIDSLPLFDTPVLSNDLVSSTLLVTTEMPNGAVQSKKRSCILFRLPF